MTGLQAGSEGRLLRRVIAFFVEYLLKQRERNHSVFGDPAGVERLRAVRVMWQLGAGCPELLFRPFEKQRERLVGIQPSFRRVVRWLSPLFLLHQPFEQQVSREDLVFPEAVIIICDSMEVVLDVVSRQVYFELEGVRYVLRDLRPLLGLHLWFSCDLRMMVY